MPGGRSNRSWRVEDPGRTPLVVKLFRPPDQNPLFPNASAAEVAALKALSGRGLAPRLVGSGHVTAGDWVAYDHVEHGPGQTNLADVASLLGVLHRQKPWAGLREIETGSDALCTQTAKIAEMAQARIALPEHAWVPPLKDKRLIHSDPVPANIVGPSQTLVLIDWQCPAFGDPAEDIAIHLSPAMQWLYAGQMLSESDEEAFLRAYPNPDVVARYRQLLPWFRVRMMAYCDWQVSQGNMDYAEARMLEAARS